MNKLYFPFYYLYVSRLKTKLEQISWIIIFIIPQLLVTHQYQTLSSVIFILLFFTSQVVFNSLYEIGYIENDVKTSKIEKKIEKGIPEKIEIISQDSKENTIPPQVDNNDFRSKLRKKQIKKR